jgi:hypothetical protein
MREDEIIGNGYLRYTDYDRASGFAHISLRERGHVKFSFDEDSRRTVRLKAATKGRTSKP